MKQTIYKIIAISSVLLGALGPQVASGTTQQQVARSAPQPQVNSNYTLNVAYTSAQQTSLEVQSSQNQHCLITTDQVRFDLMLWTGCDSLTIATSAQESLPRLAVVSQPQYLPTIVTQNPVSMGNHVSFGSGSGRDNSILPAQGFSLKNSISINLVRSGQQLSLIIEPSINSTNNLRTIVMRC